MTTEFSKKKAIGLWILSGFLAFMFIMAGGMKLAGAEQLVQNYVKWGLPDWLRYIVGAGEILGAILLLYPRFRFWGAELLSMLMVGAVWIHLTAAELGPAMVPGVLMILTGFVAYAHRQTLVRFIDNAGLRKRAVDPIK